MLSAIRYRANLLGLVDSGLSTETRLADLPPTSDGDRTPLAGTPDALELLGQRESAAPEGIDMVGFVLPFLAFVVWEFPSMIVMSLHKAVCALLGRSLEEDFLGIWGYRSLGMLIFWPASVVVLLLAFSGGLLGTVGRVLLVFEVLSIAVLLIWARLSRQGA